jgi:branched-chain amino acid transport system permease protein
MLEQIIIQGLIYGGKYALLALGFSLVFGVARIMNLTHTAYYMLSAYLIYYFHSIGLGVFFSILVVIPLVVLISVLSYHLIIEPLREQFTTVVIVSLVFAVVLQEIILIFFGGAYRSLPKIVTGVVSIFGVDITYQHFLTLTLVLLILGGVWFLLFKTRLGIAIRTTAQDREVANLMGIPVHKIALWTIAISTFLSAVAGAIVSPLYVLEPGMWLHPLIVVMASVILGGLGSIKGSICGAFILSFAEVLVVFLVPEGAYLKGSVSMMVMLVVLLIKPEGLFGIFFEGER